MNERPSITLALNAADRNADYEVKVKQTIGHLRRTARDIAATLHGVHDETAEVVTLQDHFEKSLSVFVQAMRSPAQAIGYVAPDTLRGKLTAQSVAAHAEPEGDES